MWFLIALAGPTLYAISNHLDKLILSRYIRDDNADRWVLSAFSGLFGLFVVVPILFVAPRVIVVDPLSALTLGIIGMFLVAALFCYYTALQRDEASYVVPFYQTIPIFTYVAGAVILHETLSEQQLVGGIVILAGTFLLSIEGRFADMRFRVHTLVPMIVASVLLALNDVLFKLLALDVGFWSSVFWTYAGTVVAGVGILAVNAMARTQFARYVTRNSAPGIAAASVSETLFIIAEIAMHYATLLAPVVLVSLVNAFQPLFVLVLGIVLTLFVPRLGREDISHSALAQKGFAILILSVGTVLIGR